MTNLLHIDSSILGENSVSRTLSAAAVAHLKQNHPDLAVTYRDLAASPISHLSGRYLAGQNPEVQHDQALQEELALGGAALEEFLSADIVVVGAGLYNFGIPSQLKSWVDRILVAGKTFRYTEQGPQGLAGGKKVVLALGRGGVYAPGSPHAAFEHGESYLRSVFGFIGITDLTAFVAEGVAMGPEKRREAVDGALAAIERFDLAA
ncbi:MAG: FMN-dependent NADH-azoreductase [Gluconacetobacter diazotrophicus]|nr:FMN-dependent NADH-azoreductase [Gluconacetobacter diazotrophicus]